MFTEKELTVITDALQRLRDAVGPNTADTAEPYKYNALTSLIGKSRLAHESAEKRRAKARGVADRIDEFDKQCSEAEYTDPEQAWSLLTDARAALRACAKA